MSVESPKIQYGLIYKKKDRMLGIEKAYNGDDRYACGEYTYKLSEWLDEEPWLLDDLNKVLMAKWASEEWYNSSYEEPVNPYHPTDLEIIKVVTIVTTMESDVLEELEVVNENLKEQGYAPINVKKYVHGDDPPIEEE
jgi:hypothetical protein